MAAKKVVAVKPDGMMLVRVAVSPTARLWVLLEPKISPTDKTLNAFWVDDTSAADNDVGTFESIDTVVAADALVLPAVSAKVIVTIRSPVPGEAAVLLSLMALRIAVFSAVLKTLPSVLVSESVLVLLSLLYTPLKAQNLAFPK